MLESRLVSARPIQAHFAVLIAIVLAEHALVHVSQARQALRQILIRALKNSSSVRHPIGALLKSRSTTPI